MLKKINRSMSPRRIVVIVGVCIVASLLYFAFRPNVCEYIKDNKFAMSAGRPPRFWYLVMGTPGAPYANDLAGSLILKDGSRLRLSDPDVDLLLRQCDLLGPAPREGRFFEKWPAGPLVYANSAYLKFVVHEHKLLAIVITVTDGGEGQVAFESASGVRHAVPLSRDELVDLYGGGGTFRWFLRE